MELEIALRVGVDPKRIIWNGPIKNAEKLEKFLLAGGTNNIDSIEELKIVKAIAEKNKDKILNLGIRCNYDVQDGVISRFGFDVYSADFMQVLEFVTNSPIYTQPLHHNDRQIAHHRWSTTTH
jgi:diaminopimelate decarboxylase